MATDEFDGEFTKSQRTHGSDSRIFFIPQIFMNENKQAEQSSEANAGYASLDSHCHILSFDEKLLSFHKLRNRSFPEFSLSPI